MENEDTKLYPAFKQAVLMATSTYKYGDTIPLDWLHKASEIKFPETGTKQEFEKKSLEFLAFIERFKELMLTEHKIALKNIRGEGYMLIHPRNQTPEAMKNLKKTIRRGFRKTEDMLTNIQRSMLSLQEKQENLEAISRVAAIVAFSKKKNLLS